MRSIEPYVGPKGSWSHVLADIGDEASAHTRRTTKDLRIDIADIGITCRENADSALQLRLANPIQGKSAIAIFINGIESTGQLEGKSGFIGENRPQRPAADDPIYQTSSVEKELA